MWWDCQTLAGFWWNNQISSSPRREYVQVGKVSTPHTVEWQQTATCIFLAPQPTHICRVLSNFLYEACQGIGCSEGITCLTTQDQLYTHTQGYILYLWSTMRSYQLAKYSLRTNNRIRWNDCNKYWSRIRQNLLMANVYCSSMTILGFMWHGCPGILCGDLAGRYTAIHLTHQR